MVATTGTSWRVEVVVLPKSGVNDPEGESIRGGLRGLGFGQVERVRAGRVFQLLVDAPDPTAAREAVVEMCERLLANPVIETYEVASVGIPGTVTKGSVVGEPAEAGPG